MGPRMNLISTIIAFVMSATFIMFVCTRIICGRIRRSRLQTQSGINLEQPEEQIRGLEPVVVDAMPTLKFNSEEFSSIEDTQCSICLGEYQEKQVLRIMPKCGHNFHLSCIDLWLRKQSTCPVCRVPLLDVSEAKRMRAATFRMNSHETSTEHARHWLLPFPGPQSFTANRIDNRDYPDLSSTTSEMNT